MKEKVTTSKKETKTTKSTATKAKKPKTAVKKKMVDVGAIVEFDTKEKKPRTRKKAKPVNEEINTDLSSLGENLNFEVVPDGVAPDVNKEVEPVKEEVPPTPILPDEEVKEEKPEPSVENAVGHPVTIGDDSCYAYISVKMTGSRFSTTPISLGVAGSESSFYAEFIDYDMLQVSPEMLDTVLKKLINPPTKLEGPNWTIRGTIEDVRKAFIDWIDTFYTSKGKFIQFVGDKITFEYGILIRLLIGSNVDVKVISKNISPNIIDLNQEIAQVISPEPPEGVKYEDYIHNFVPFYAALGVDRFDLACNYDEFKNKTTELNKDSMGNALINAYAIRVIHRHIWGLV